MGGRRNYHTSLMSGVHYLLKYVDNRLTVRETSRSHAARGGGLLRYWILFSSVYYCCVSLSFLIETLVL